MRKVLTLVAVLSVFAVPALAQQRQESLVSQHRAQVSAAVAQPQAAAAQQAEPTFHVSREQIREQVRAAEEQRTGEQVGSQSWWYLVLAIAVGVLIAAVVLD